MFGWLRRDVLLMLLPVAFIGYYGWSLARNPALQTPPSPGPSCLRLIKVQKLPLTPLDVARGGDTKIHVEIETAGTPPRADLSIWDFSVIDGLIGQQGKKEKRLTDDFKRLPSGEYVTRA